MPIKSSSRLAGKKCEASPTMRLVTFPVKNGRIKFIRTIAIASWRHWQTILPRRLPSFEKNTEYSAEMALTCGCWIGGKPCGMKQAMPYEWQALKAISAMPIGKLLNAEK